MSLKLTLEQEQKLIDIVAECYSPEDIFTLGKLCGIKKAEYYGYGMNLIQLANAFVERLQQKEKSQTLFEVIVKSDDFQREEMQVLIDEVCGKTKPDSVASEIIKPGEVSIGDGLNSTDKNLRFGLHAIVIGINIYEFQGGRKNLRFAANDAKEMVDFLEQRWHIPSENICAFMGKAYCGDIMRGIRSMCDSLTENDNLLFFFSGHGKEVKGSSYLCVTDTNFDENKDIYSAIKLEELNEIIRNCKANLTVRFFDACQCGESFSKEFDDEEEFENVMTSCMQKDLFSSGSGWVTFCSCNINESSHEVTEMRHGAFTYYLLEGLEGKARRGFGRMHIEDIKIYVSDMVTRIIKKQNPQYHCEIEGNIIVE